MVVSPYTASAADAMVGNAILYAYVKSRHKNGAEIAANQFPPSMVRMDEPSNWPAVRFLIVSSSVYSMSICSPAKAFCSCCAQRRTCRTWSRYRRVPACAPDGFALPSQGPWRTPTALPSPALLRASAMRSSISCAADPFGDVPCMGGDLCGHNALLHVLHIWQRQVFCRRHIAEKGCACCRSNGSADSRRNVVITGAISVTIGPSTCAARRCRSSAAISC